MIREQAAYPPNYAVRIRGTHTETYKTRDRKTEKKVVVDFDIRLNMTQQTFAHAMCLRLRLEPKSHRKSTKHQAANMSNSLGLAKKAIVAQ
jgi:hypothetical protein